MKIQVSISQVYAELARRGILRHLLSAEQRKIYDFIERALGPIICIEAHRKSGKTKAALCYGLEHGARNRDLICLCTDARQHLTDIILPMYRAIYSQHCPDWSEVGKRLLHKNGSEMALYGADRDNADSMRGPAYGLALIDEAAYVDNLRYLVEDVLIPTSNETGAKIILTSSTCKQYNHAFSAYCDQAKATGNYYKLTLDNNSDKDANERQAIEAGCGGRQSILFRRDYLCERITDPERAALPEMEQYYNQIVVDTYDRPQYYELYGALDVGFADATAYLLGYYDYERGNYVVDAETMLRHATTQQVNDAIRDIEQRSHKMRVYRRVSDTDLRIIADLNRAYNLSISAVHKDNKAAQIAFLRQLMASGRLKILSRCHQLITQCRSVTYTKTFSGWEHADGHHYDLVDALIYLVRSIIPTSDPRPALPPGVSERTHALPVHLQGIKNKLKDGAEVFNDIF